MMKRTTISFFLVCIFLFTFLWWNGQKGLDPDFGWHLRMGQLILTSGVPSHDPFSYTMSYYPFVDHEWITNIAIALLYPVFGLSGLTVLAISIAFAAILLQTIFLKKQWLVIPLLLAGTAFSGYLGIRPQVLSWLFVLLLLLVFLHEKLWRVGRFLLPILMLVWVNMHGSFALGVMLIGLVVGIKQFQAKKILIVDWVVSLATIATTFFTPYWWRGWWEVWMQMSDTGLRWSIQEWMPAICFFNMSFMLLLPLSVLLVIRYRKRFSLIEVVLYTVLLLMGLSSARHLPFWLLLSLSMTTKAISYFAADVQKNAFGRERFPKAYAFLLGAVGVIVVGQLVLSFVLRASNQIAAYPNQAVHFLKTHPSAGNLLATYDMGGYLLWQYPQKKVFIDGRMPSWRASEAPVGQSTNAFLEYNKVFGEAKSTLAILRKYHIDTVIFSRIEEPRYVITLSRTLRKFGLLFPDMEEFKKELQKEHFKLVYKDKSFVIYRKEGL